MEFARTNVDIWYDDSSVQTVGGTIATDTTWSAAGDSDYSRFGITTNQMNKNDIEEITIYVTSGDRSFLAMMLRKDGTIGRSGNGGLPGTLPGEGVCCLGADDGTVFRTMIACLLADQVFPHAGSHTMKQIKGMPLTYALRFDGKKDTLASFELTFGLENKDAGHLVAYFQQYIQRAINLTEDWHKEALKNGIPMTPNKSPEPTAGSAGSSAFAVRITDRRWLSFHR
jgi:hypothetical protein